MENQKGIEYCNKCTKVITGMLSVIGHILKRNENFDYELMCSCRSTSDPGDDDWGSIPK